MRSKPIICLVALFWTGASLGNGRTNAIDSTVFDKICARLMEIPEVDSQLQVIGDASNHTKGLFVHVDAKPGKSRNYYDLALQYDNGIAYVTYFRFYVWPRSMKIRILDVVSGEMVTLDEWRVRRKSRPRPG